MATAKATPDEVHLSLTSLLHLSYISLTSLLHLSVDAGAEDVHSLNILTDFEEVGLGGDLATGTAVDRRGHAEYERYLETVQAVCRQYDLPKLDDGWDVNLYRHSMDAYKQTVAARESGHLTPFDSLVLEDAAEHKDQTAAQDQWRWRWRWA